MKCPICRKHSLNEVSLNTGLLAQQCQQCEGHWISSEAYWAWLNQRSQQQQQPIYRPPIVVTNGECLPVVDNHTANFCADCDHLMTKARVGRGLSFYLDRCSHCHGVWLDKNEWENLQRFDLHHQIHYMFSSTWQLQVRKEKQIYQKTPA